MIVTYRQLSEEARRITFDKYNALCDDNPEFFRFGSFEEYDDEQELIDMSFDLETLECIG